MSTKVSAYTKTTSTFTSKFRRICRSTDSPLSYTPLIQPLPGSSAPRTNVVEDLFFLIRGNQTWTGIGYFVRNTNSFFDPAGVGPVGTLYRFEMSTNAVQFAQHPDGLFNTYLTATNASRILDGVVHFRVRAYDIDGRWLTNNYNSFKNTTNANMDIRLSSVAPGEVGYGAFYSNAVPASVELEIGILETRVVEQVKAIGIPAAQQNFLQNSNQAGHVHLFRQRIPIRNVDPAAYP